MKEKPDPRRYEKKHSFFQFEEDLSDPKKPKRIANAPNVVGKQNFPSFADRFNDLDYLNNSGGKDLEKPKSLVIKIMPTKLSPRTFTNLKRQILYIGRMSAESGKSLGLELKGEEEIASIGADVGVKLYNQDFRILDKQEAEIIAAEWLKDCKKNEVVSRHILLSIGGKEDKNKTLAVTKLFLEDVFRSKGFDYFFAAHNDTVNDHFHVIVKKKNNLGQNLRFSKNDVFILRQKYADYLAQVGIKRQVLARRDQKQIIEKVEEGVEHMKNNNTWYQAKLNKGNQKDFNAYNYKANLTGRIEEIINLLTLKQSLRDLGIENENILNRLKAPLKTNGIKITLDSLLAVKQMQAKGVKITSLEGMVIQAVERMWKPNKVKEVKTVKNDITVQKKVLIPILTQNQIQDKFKEAVFRNFSNQKTSEDLHKYFDKAFVQAASNIGKKIRFGDKDSCEIVWYGEGGYVLDYRVGEAFKWNKSKIKNEENLAYKEISPAEIERQNHERKLSQQKLEIERQELFGQVSEKAENLFQEYSDKKESSSAYLVKKGIADLNIKNIKYHAGKLVIPVMDTEEKIWSLQYIEEDSSKKFLKNGRKQGNFFVLQNNLPESKKLSEEKTIFLAEGFATAATIHKATGSNVVVCFDAGNIKDVLSNLVTKFPDKQFVIAGDNDLWSGVNTGREKASEAVEKYQDKVDVRMILPQFSYEHKDDQPTDFNDLQALSGIDEVRKQILEGMMRKVESPKKQEALDKREEDQLVINFLKDLKEKILDSEDKKFIRNQVDETLNFLKVVDEKLAKNINEKINNDEVRYSYVQPKEEVKYFEKIKTEQGLKITT